MASHSIAFSCSLLSDARRPLSTQYTHSAPFNPVPVHLNTAASQKVQGSASAKGFES